MVIIICFLVAFKLNLYLTIVIQFFILNNKLIFINNILFKPIITQPVELDYSKEFCLYSNHLLLILQILLNLEFLLVLIFLFFLKLYLKINQHLKNLQSNTILINSLYQRVSLFIQQVSLSHHLLLISYFVKSKIKNQILKILLQGNLLILLDYLILFIVCFLYIQAQEILRMLWLFLNCL